MNTFTNILPAPSPFGQGPQYIAINRKDGTIKSPLSELQLSLRFGPHWANENNGDDYVWTVLAPDLHKLLLQPAQGASDDGKVEALRARCRTALNRVDAARGILEQAMDELESGVLG